MKAIVLEMIVEEKRSNENSRIYSELLEVTLLNKLKILNFASASVIT